MSKVVRYRMGNLQKTFPLRLTLRARNALQIRHNAIESARQTSNKLLEKELGNNFHFAVRMYPHHVLRENALASGAGADRLSTGMSHAFGKVIGIAARIKEGQALFSVEVEKDKLDVAKRALHRASFKVPCKTFVTIDSSLKQN